MPEHVDLVVAVDFGMTCTGVAWGKPSLNTTGAIGTWPGMTGSGEIKVPTQLIYANSAVAKWGFLCEEDEDDEDVEIKEWFKIYLDETKLAIAQRQGVSSVPSSVDEYTMEATSGSWRDKRVKFLFSTPTTWTSQDILTSFKRVIINAGFGSANPALHSVDLGLTEAEAVAVFTLKSPPVEFSAGDLILVCDAGGGTTDLGLVEITDPSKHAPILKQVAGVCGVGVGSTVIDREFEDLVQARLDAHQDAAFLPPNLAEKLSKRPFSTIKHKFGSRSANTNTFFVKTGVGNDFNHPGLRIRNGKMEFTRDEIKGLFDPQIRVIFKKIHEQLDWLANNRSTEHVKYLVLSGGFGGSEYLKTRLLEHFRDRPHPSAPNIAMIRSEEPRLAVSKGLVFDQMRPVLKYRVARASYGVLCRRPYDPAIHVGADVEMDLYKSGLKWATNQIDWFIKRGDLIDTELAFKERPFSRKLRPGETNRIWDTTIIISHNDRNSLPTSTKKGGALKLCVVKSDLSHVKEHEFQLKNKRCWQGPRYYLASFNIRFVIGPSDLTFELFFKGTKYSRGHDPITVEWDHAGASAREPASEDSGVPDQLR